MNGANEVKLKTSLDETITKIQSNAAMNDDPIQFGEKDKEILDKL